MPPDQPSQRGKFRPKRPQKKTAKSGAAAEAVGTVSSSSSAIPSVAFSDPNVAVADRRNTIEGGRGRGRGRAGGRGRGRGRGPSPQGKVFFTGGEKQPGSVKGSSKRTTVTAGSSRGKGNSKKRADDKGDRNLLDTGTEEVVGQLDTAIGGSGNSKKPNIFDKDLTDYHDNEEGVVDDSGGALNMNVSCMYDSDSSDERFAMKSRENVNVIAPLELPFSTRSLPTIDYDTPSSNKPDAVTSSNCNESNTLYHSELAQPMSPFFAMHKNNEKLDEKNAWFMVQLPTRLPPLQKKSFSNQNDDVAAGGRGGARITEGSDTVNETTSSSDTNILNNISEVIVPPVTTSNFDNGLDTIAPGRIGKIVVYKSGKTILVVDSPDSKKISMEVNEGLTCTFHQEAIAVSVEEGNFISLGDVNKSIVISPDLTNIMSG
mmetsp:Transcript_1265/g.1443  ORF Transcript_1265/g.1443 Transcript_1265/m.1443 type:complete len:430 (+) Transcript_1265:39-1328(+)